MDQLAFELPPEEQETGVPGTFTIFGSEEQESPLNPIVAQARAEKYNVAMGTLSPGKDQIEQALYAGSEGNLRLSLISNEALRAQRIRQAVAEDIVRGKEGPLNEQETAAIKALTAREADAALTNPSIIMEKLYGRQVVDFSSAVSPTSAYNRMLESGGVDEADRLSERNSDIAAKKERAQRLLEDLNERWGNAGWVSTISNYAETVFPFFSAYNTRNAIPNITGKSPLLPGSNLEGQIMSYYTMPLNQADVALTEAVRVMEQANPLDAKHFLEAMIGYTNSDKFWDNAVGLVDAATVVPVTPVAKATVATARMLKDVVKVATKPGVKAAEVLEATGERTLMAQDYFTKAVTAAQERAANQGTQASWDDMMGKLPLLMNPKAFIEGGELAKSAPFLQKATEELTRTSAKMIDGIINEPISIANIVPGTPAFDEAVREAVERAGKSYPNLVDNVMYAAPGRPMTGGAFSDVTLGSDRIDVFIGTKAGTPFDTEKAAQATIERNYMKDAVVEPVGNGFGIRYSTFVNYSDPKVRSLLVPTDAPTPKDHKNLWMGWMRTPNEILPKDLVNDRAIATYGISKMAEMAQTMLTEIRGSLSKADLDDFNKFISKQRATPNPANADKPGIFSKNLAEFEQQWMNMYGRNPDEATAIAYMRYVQLYDMEYSVLNMINHKNKTAMGIQTINFGIPFGNVKAEGRIIRDDPFLSGEPFSFLLWDDKLQTMVPDLNWFPNSAKVKGGVENFKQRIEKEGLTWVNLTVDGEKALRADPRISGLLPDRKIDYVLMKDPKAEALSMNQLPYRPGGHRTLKDGFYISQPDISRRERAGGAVLHFYHGDNNMAHFVREADARDMMTRIEKARQIYHTAKTQKKDLNELSQYLANELPGLFTVNEFAALFKKGGPFKLDTPFFVRATGSSVNDTHNLSTMYSNLRMGTDDVHSIALQRMDPQYFKERGDIFPTFAWRGSDSAPVIESTAAELIDPLDTLERSFQNIIRSKYLDDLRVKTTERFINEFAGVLDTPIEQLRANPWGALLEPAYKKGADKATIQAANQLRRTLLEFLNIQTPLEKTINYTKQKLADSIYQTIGKDGYAKLERGRELLDKFSLGATKDPIKFIRSLAFHEKLGLFNVKQAFLQAQNLTTVLALEPTNGLKAMGAYYPMRGALMNSNPEIVEKMASLATKFGWKKDEFMESWNAGYRSGFFRVGGEVAYHDLGATPSLTVTTFGKMLDSATVFFREGERISRITAWNAAYLRWKSLNPGKELTDLEVSRILARADDLNGNMSRASNAMWQQGVFSIPTQFWGYQARMSELMLGKRLTVAEKARLVTGYSLMYGLPTGFAIAGPGMVWPWQEATRQYLLENGMAYNDSALQKIATDGLGGIAAGIIFGEDVNFSEQYSPQGMSVVKDFIEGDKGIVDMMLGVGGTTAVDNIKSFTPFVAALGKVAGMDGGYDLTARDFSDAFSHISSFSNAAKAMHAYSAQEYWSKKEQLVSRSEVNAWQAVLIGATGLIPKHVTDAYAMVSSLKDRQRMQEEIKTELIKQLRLGFKANTPSEADVHFRRAQIHFKAGQFTAQEYSQILRTASTGYRPLADSIAQKYATTSPERMKDMLRRGPQ